METFKALIPGFFALVAFVLSCVSNFHCATLELHSDFASYMTGNQKDTLILTVGPFSNSSPNDSKCIPLIGDTDARWKMVQAFAIIVAVIGGIAMIYCFLSPCLNVATRYWKCVGAAFFFCCIFQGITLDFINQPNCNATETLGSLYCKWGWGTKTNIAAVVLWFIPGFLMLTFIKPPNQDPESPVQAEP